MSDNRKVNRLCNVLTVVCCLIRLLSERWGITLTWPHPDPLQQVERELPSRERRLLRRLRLLAMTNRNAVRGFSLVPGLGLHDLKRSHYRRVESLGGEIATPRQVVPRNDRGGRAGWFCNSSDATPIRPATNLEMS
jgi:hypothetical protein